MLRYFLRQRGECVRSPAARLCAPDNAYFTGAIKRARSQTDVFQRRGLLAHVPTAGAGLQGYHVRLPVELPPSRRRSLHAVVALEPSYGALPARLRVDPALVRPLWSEGDFFVLLYIIGAVPGRWSAIPWRPRLEVLDDIIRRRGHAHAKRPRLADGPKFPVHAVNGQSGSLCTSWPDAAVHATVRAVKEDVSSDPGLSS